MNSKRDAGGFTLLEILMVMVIIGAMLSVATLVMPAGPERQARGEAQRLVQWLHAARESAVLEGREHGLRLTPQGYRALYLQGGQWQAGADLHPLPAMLTMELRLAGLAVDLQRRDNQPQLLALSSDEYSPFEVTFYRHQQPLSSVSGDGLGEPLIHEY